MHRRSRTARLNFHARTLAESRISPASAHRAKASAPVSRDGKNVSWDAYGVRRSAPRTARHGARARPARSREKSGSSRTSEDLAGEVGAGQHLGAKSSSVRQMQAAPGARRSLTSLNVRMGVRALSPCLRRRFCAEQSARLFPPASALPNARSCLTCCFAGDPAFADG